MLPVKDAPDGVCGDLKALFPPVAVGEWDRKLSDGFLNKFSRLRQLIEFAHRVTGNRVERDLFVFEIHCGKDHRIVFYSPTCEHCRELLAALDAFRAAHPGTRILLVDMDAFMAQDPDAAEAVLQALDLSTLPMIFRTGRRGRVKDKYLDNL